MKRIPLTQGFEALVDDDDFERLSQWRWQVHTKRLANGGARRCAIRTDHTGTKKRTVYMHREVLCAPADLQVDHRNGDPLDNRRENLRAATNQENQRNVRKKGGRGSPSSEFKGVGWHAQGGCWRARITLPGGRRLCLGSFTCETNAALAYDEAAREHFGEFARLNFPTYQEDIASIAASVRRLLGRAAA